MTKKENPKALKHLFDQKLLNKIANAIGDVHPTFNQKSFLKIEKQLILLEMKDRVKLISQTLFSQLPSKYPDALKIILKSIESKKLNGFDLWPYTDFIQCYGLDYFDLSMNALKVITIDFTGEFAVRPYIKKYPKESLQFLLKCAKDNNVHLRRWASEGSRPRLPWGQKIDLFVDNPKHTIEILDLLKDDSELYVRKSVANHLNDISKDHPDFIVKLLNRWVKRRRNQNLDWIISHSLRTLIKRGHVGALELMGARQDIKVKMSSIKIFSKKVDSKNPLEFSFKIESKHRKPQKIIVDYVVDFIAASGKKSSKVFKLSKFELCASEQRVLVKKHSFKPITTRRYFAGVHGLKVQVNGKIMAKTTFILAT